MLLMGESANKKGLRHAECAMILTNNDNSDEEIDDWILNNESSRHLVNNAFLLQDARDCDYECHLADGKGIKLSRVDKVC